MPTANSRLRLYPFIYCIIGSAQALAFGAAARAGDPAQKPAKLSVDQIYASGDFHDEGFGAEWLPDSSGCVMTAPSAGPGGGRDIVKMDPASGEREVLVPAAHLVPQGGSSPLAVDGFTLSADGAKILIYTDSKRVWRVRSKGDYWVLDRASRELAKLGGNAPESSLMHAKFSPDGTKVAYVRENDIYVEHLSDHKIIRLTSSQSPDEINGTFDWVYEEEFFLRDGFRFSPDGDSIAYWRLNTHRERAFPLVNNAAGLYPTVMWYKYPKVGERNAECFIQVTPADAAKSVRVNVAGDPAENYIASMEWIRGDGENPKLVLQQLNRRQNTVRVMIADPAKNDPAKIILTESDDAWVDLQAPIHWIKRDQAFGFLWLSERSGWRHIYFADLSGGKPAPITAGDYDVIEIEGVDQTLGWVYFSASPQNATQKYLYRARIDGSTPAGERVSQARQSGTHDNQISPDGKWSIHRFSTFDQPPIVDLVRLPSGDRVRLLVENQPLRDRLAELKHRPVEFVQVPIPGGHVLDAWRITPPDFDPAKSYPLVVHVYGEPAWRTVLDAWHGDQTLWHRLLAQEGYVVMSFDNRGTPAPKGRAWRKAAFHKVGILAPEEQAQAVERTLRDNAYLDRKRVGVWGWSGGGSMSLNAIFKHPDLYSVAIAIAPVANQRYYDTIYQERYMGLPGDNPEGFEKGSPINFAGQLKGKLLLVHGTGDDNCHYQTTEALINELIRLDKPFTMMAYPNRTHAINEGANTTIHLRRLMTRYLLENLPAGAKPRE